MKKKPQDEYIAHGETCAAILRVKEFAQACDNKIIATAKGKELRMTDLVTVLFSVIIQDEHLVRVADGEPVPVNELSEKEAKGILCAILREQRIEQQLAQQVMGAIVMHLHPDEDASVPPPGAKLH